MVQDNGFENTEWILGDKRFIGAPGHIIPGWRFMCYSSSGKIKSCEVTCPKGPQFHFGQNPWSNC